MSPRAEHTRGLLIIRGMATTERRPGPGDESTEHLTVAPVVGPDDPRRFTDSGIEIGELYRETDLPEQLDLGEPGEFPYTRGIHPGMYRRQTWTMRQYAGYASANESNERYRYLLSKGSTGLSMAFDLPTQLGLDSDSPRSLGEVGRTGVAIDTVDDMRIAFDGIPLDQVSTSMTINAPAAVLLLLYELVGEEQGVPAEEDRKSTRLNSSHGYISHAVFCLKKQTISRPDEDLPQTTPPAIAPARRHTELGKPCDSDMHHLLEVIGRLPHARPIPPRRPPELK